MAIRKAYSQPTLTALLAISVVLGGLGASHSAAATPTRTTTEINSARVSFDDLDLSTDKGAREVLSRVHQAARDVCIRSYEMWAPYINLQSGFVTCVKEASNRAVAQLNNPLVTAAYTGEKATQLAETKISP
jgi:UrcA family protein